MVKGINFLVVSILFLISPLDIWATESWSDYFVIDHIEPINEGSFAVYPQNAPVNGCSFFRVYINTSGVTADGAKTILSTALAAGAQKLPFRLYFEDVSGYCYSKYWYNK